MSYLWETLLVAGRHSKVLILANVGYARQKIGDATPPAKLPHLLASKEREVSPAAAALLLEDRPWGAIPALISVMLNLTPDDYLHMANTLAAYILGEMRAVPATPALIKVLDNHRYGLRSQWEACRSLGGLRATSAVPSLARKLEGDGLVMPVLAAQALGEIAATDESIAALREVVRRGRPSSSQLADAWVENRPAAVWAAQAALKKHGVRAHYRRRPRPPSRPGKSRDFFGGGYGGW